LLVFVYSDYYGSSEKNLVSLVRWYLISCLCVALFGVVQFFAGIEGHELLITQWLIYKQIPRLNGISYEPSYFAIYMIGAWGTVAVLLDYNVQSILPRRTLQAALVLLTTVIVLSTSRSGIAACYGGFVLFAGYWLLQAIKGRRIGAWRYWLMFIGIGLPLVVTYIAFLKFPAFAGAMVGGLGIDRTSSYSVLDRFRAYDETLRLVRRHSIVGVGIGGIGPSIAESLNPGITLESYLRDKINGLNVFLEAFAAGGIVGGLAFIGYLISLFAHLAKRLPLKDDLSRISLALGLGLLFELFLLVFEQNLVRVYLWIHIAVFSAALSANPDAAVCTPKVNGAS